MKDDLLYTLKCLGIVLGFLLLLSLLSACQYTTHNMTITSDNGANVTVSDGNQSDLARGQNDVSPNTTTDVGL